MSLTVIKFAHDMPSAGVVLLAEVLSITSVTCSSTDGSTASALVRLFPLHVDIKTDQVSLLPKQNLKSKILKHQITWFTQTTATPNSNEICCKRAAKELSCLALLTRSLAPNSLLNKAAIESITISLILPWRNKTGAFFVTQNCKSPCKNRGEAEGGLSANYFCSANHCR